MVSGFDNSGGWCHAVGDGVGVDAVGMAPKTNAGGSEEEEGALD